MSLSLRSRLLVASLALVTGPGPASASSSPAPVLTVTDEILHPLPAALFGQFLERPSWYDEYGPEAVCDADGRLSPVIENALAGLHAPVVRFPHGTDGDYTCWTNLADLPGRAERPLTVGYKGGAPVTNRFGFPEYFELARRQGWRTILVGNLRDALYKKKPLAEAAAHSAALLRYALTLAPAESIAAFQVGNEGWFFWPPKPAERAALGLADDAACAEWLRSCWIAYADALREVSPAIPLICDAPRPPDGAGDDTHVAPVWRAAVDHPEIRSRYAMLAAHAYAPMGLWTTERRGEKVAASALTPDEIWLAAVAALGRFDAAGQCVADAVAYDDITALGFRAAVTEWNWNGWDWSKRFPQAGFSDGVPAALGTAGFLHGLMRHPGVSLAAQSIMLGTSWGITGVRVAKDGSVGYLPQAEAVRLHAEFHGDHVVKSTLAHAVDLGPAPRLASWWPAVNRVAQLDTVVTADDTAWFVHIVHRHRTDATTLQIALPASTSHEGTATLHLLTGSLQASSATANGLTRTTVPLTRGSFSLTMELPPAAVAVVIIPRR